MQWFGEYEGLATLHLLKAISTIAKRQQINRADLSKDEAERAISLWKGSLTRPDCAGYAGSNGDAYVAIYREFEELRHENNAITFDDFIPLAIALIQSDRSRLSKHASALKYIIVDEYQDINLGQERLIELLATCGADVMVVGDDDQTIYEWRGARSEYILSEFMTTFSNKPHLTYRLTRSFRFGYSIAQASNNVIAHNTNRLEKTLVANKPRLDSHITIIDSEDVNHRLTNEIINLVKHKKVPPSEIRVLGRTYAQLNSLTTEFMLRKIPFKVEGASPFIKSGECKVLLDYIRGASSLDLIPDKTLEPPFLNIANKPNRYLGHADLRRMLQRGHNDGKSFRDLLSDTTQDPASFSSNTQRENLKELLSFLEELDLKICENPRYPAAKLLDWIEKRIELQEHYRNHLGEGETSLGRSYNLSALIAYAHHTALSWRAFIEHVERFDSTQGRPEDAWIRMMTIHKTKGLEFDYVVIPDCQEGFMPVFAESEDPTYDTEHPKREPRAAEWIENERRLFYVGATRARKGLFIGAPPIVSAPQQEQGDAKKSDTIASRFLEECELDPTLELAHEVVLAARHQESHFLVQKCRRWAAYHRIVGLVKDHYSRDFTQQVRRELAAVRLSEAERPFRYKQRYNSPKKDIARTDGATNRDVWDWIPSGRKKRKKAIRPRSRR